jgi:hypothetical protein
VSPTDDDRIAYLAGEAVDSLRADDRAALSALRAELGSPSIWEEPGAGLEDLVVAAVVREAGAHAPAPSRTQDQPARRRAVAPAGLRSLLARLSSRRPALSVAMAVAVAAVVAAVVFAANQGDSAPEQEFAMVVLGTSLAPRAHGSATLTKMSSGWQIKLSATGLSRRDGRDFYEAWLKNPAGTLVPVGTFNDARQVTLWSGVPVTKFRALTVTQQVANGNPASSGRRVLTGKIR